MGGYDKLLNEIGLWNWSSVDGEVSSHLSTVFAFVVGLIYTSVFSSYNSPLNWSVGRLKTRLLETI